MKLLIVETEIVRVALAKCLHDGWKIAVSGKNICVFPQDRLGINLKYFEPEYQLSPLGREKIITLRRLANFADAVYLGMSNDNNGEALAAHIQEYLNHDIMRRVELPEVITAVSVHNALANHRMVDYSRVDIVLAEQMIDRLASYEDF
ncbi:MAG: hypothetical protein COC15_05095 [Legionellales bacterium]|nr:MAG: hypothetical protein COC15_05095 [Legionellales bacterium]